MLRRLLPALLAVAALLIATAPAGAATQNDLERGRAEISRASALVDQSLDASKAGNRAQAYKLARDAYLNHYEFVEIPMRLRDPNKVLDTEFKFTRLRNDIRDGASLDRVRSDVTAVRAGLVASDRARAEKGGAPAAGEFGLSY